LYRTGDRVRRLANGAIEYLGRLDYQVKLRGYRIELGEIEAVLRQHPEIDQAVVTLQSEESGDRLVAFLVPDCPAEVKSFLQERLPSYMIPAIFVPIAHLPLTPNGKIDRRSLPLPAGDRPALTNAFALPQTEVEQAIAQIWQQALKLDRVGIHDNFFELGGHSLLIVSVYNQLKERLNLDLLLVDLFRYPTIASLAAALSQPEATPSIDLRKNQLTAGKARLQQRRRVTSPKLPAP
ncbi:MAG: non-ribosomal peptide synthase, partial [Leptolyngbyaceae cyanobacterium SM1_3_5]|nr:non-ribosomal peptide synthase [Leptolyngbyaceae cyanobacterium SM1_3_5]